MGNNEIYIDGVNVSECKYFNKVVNEEPYCNIDEEHLYTCSSDENCYYKQFKHLQRENKEKINIIEQIIKILYPNANDDELYDVTFNGEYIDKLKELKDTADTMLMANDIKKQEIDSLREYLERLEQENENLKKEVKQIGSDFIKKGDYARELEQENKELRQQYNCYACDTCQGKEDYRNMKRHSENAIKTVHTYRSALEEIREIVASTFAKQRPYKEDFTEIETIINEVLK